jgi:hypothetical protein
MHLSSILVGFINAVSQASNMTARSSYLSGTVHVLRAPSRCTDHAHLTADYGYVERGI